MILQWTALHTESINLFNYSYFKSSFEKKGQKIFWYLENVVTWSYFFQTAYEIVQLLLRGTTVISFELHIWNLISI